MYIGFSGVSGAGKSTIASAVAAKLRQERYRVAYYSPFFKPGSSRLYKIGWSLYLWRWFDWELVRFFVSDTTQRTWTKHTWWRIYMALIMAYYLDQVQKKYDVLIYDEDMIKWQALPVAEGWLDKELVKEKYEGKVLAGAEQGLLVWVDTPPEEAARRFLKRGDGSGRSAAELQRETAKWAKWQQATQDLLQYVSQQTALHAVTVDGQQAPEESAVEVVVKLREIGLPAKPVASD